MFAGWYMYVGDESIKIWLKNINISTNTIVNTHLTFKLNFHIT